MVSTQNTTEKPQPKPILEREKWLFLQETLTPQEYLNYLKEILPIDDERLVFLTKLLTDNNQISTWVLFRSYRLIENILLWDLNEGKVKPWKERNGSTAAVLLSKLTQVLDYWERAVFRRGDSEYSAKEPENQYRKAARFIISQVTPLFASIPALKSPDVKAQTIRTALFLISENKEHNNHISALLSGRANATGAKADIGEDEFYAALIELVASWNDKERKEITKQLGDMLSIDIDEEQNKSIYVPVTETMASLASLILANIRMHNQNDADFDLAPANKKKVYLAARGTELGTEPIGMLVDKLAKALKNGNFSESEQQLANQVFEMLLIDARLFNPAVVLGLIETYGQPKLREALMKAYSRRDQDVSIEIVDDVLTYLVTGTFAAKPSHQTHSLAEQGLGWLLEDLEAAGLTKLTAKLIRSTAKFGLHSVNGVNPLPQSYVFTREEEIEQKELDLYFSQLDAPAEQQAKAYQSRKKDRQVRYGQEGDLKSIGSSLITNRPELTAETRESLSIRMKRFLEVENTLWNAVASTLRENSTKASKTAVALWSMSLTICCNLLSEPNSEFFKIDPKLVETVSTALAQRITARYEAITKLHVIPEGETSNKIKNTFLLSINQAAAKWSPRVVTAIFEQIKVSVAQNDSHYFSGLVPDIVNAITLETVAAKEAKTADYRKAYRGDAVKLLVELLISFTANNRVIGGGARMSLVTALSSIKGDLAQLAELWNPTKEFQWKEKINREGTRHQDREIAAVAQLLNLLAGHAGGTKADGDAAAGQILLANEISKAIGHEIAAVFQAEMPSATLLLNITESRMTLDSIHENAEGKATALTTTATKQLKELTQEAAAGELTLASIQKLIVNGLGSFESTIGKLSSFKTEGNSPAAGEENTKVNLLDALTAMAQQYLVNNHNPEVAPIGAVLANELARRFHDENLAMQPISALRAKIAQVLENSVAKDIIAAAQKDAVVVGQQVLADSLARYIAAAELFSAVEKAQYNEADKSLIRAYLEQVERVRLKVADPNGEIERHLKLIRTNLTSVLGKATHLIQIPSWNSVSGFMTAETQALLKQKVKSS